MLLLAKAEDGRRKLDEERDLDFRRQQSLPDPPKMGNKKSTYIGHMDAADRWEYFEEKSNREEAENYSQRANYEDEYNQTFD